MSLKRSVDGSVLKRKLDRIADLERHRANPVPVRNVIIQTSSNGHLCDKIVNDFSLSLISIPSTIYRYVYVLKRDVIFVS